MSAVAWWYVIDEQAGLYCYQKLEDDVCTLRATALRLADGSFCVVSPIKETAEEGHRWLEERGGVSVLLAPNGFHNMGLQSFVDRHGAFAVANSRRVTKVTGLETSPLEALAERLPQHARLVPIPGSKVGEVWLVVETSQGPLWVVGDAFTYFPRTPRTLRGLVLWLFNFTPGLCIGSSFKHIALADRAAYREWLFERLAEAPPTRLVPCHGHPVDVSGQELLDLARRRL